MGNNGCLRSPGGPTYGMLAHPSFCHNSWTTCWQHNRFLHFYMNTRCITEHSTSWIPNNTISSSSFAFICMYLISFYQWIKIEQSTFTAQEQLSVTSFLYCSLSQLEINWTLMEKNWNQWAHMASTTAPTFHFIIWNISSLMWWWVQIRTDHWVNCHVAQSERDKKFWDCSLIIAQDSENP